MNLLDILSELSIKIFWSMWVSIGFAVLFNTPKRAMWIVGLLGAIGWTVKFTLMKSILPHEIVMASFTGACTVGFLGMYFAHRVHTPPIVFTLPAVINMIPGKYGYEFMMGLIKIVTAHDDSEITFELVIKTIRLGLHTGFITMGLAFGIIAPILLLNTYSVKGKDLNAFIKKRIKRRIKRKNLRKLRKKRQ